MIAENAATVCTDEPALVREAAYQRLRPELVAEFAHEFTALLQEVSARDVGVENTQRLNVMLDAFEDLFVEMRNVCSSIRSST